MHCQMQYKDAKAFAMDLNFQFWDFRVVICYLKRKFQNCMGASNNFYVACNIHAINAKGLLEFLEI